MARKARAEVEGGLYLVITRGNNRRQIWILTWSSSRSGQATQTSHGTFSMRMRKKALH